MVESNSALEFFRAQFGPDRLNFETGVMRCQRLLNLIYTIRSTALCAISVR